MQYVAEQGRTGQVMIKGENVYGYSPSTLGLDLVTAVERGRLGTYKKGNNLIKETEGTERKIRSR